MCVQCQLQSLPYWSPSSPSFLFLPSPPSPQAQSAQSRILLTIGALRGMMNFLMRSRDALQYHFSRWGIYVRNTHAHTHTHVHTHMHTHTHTCTHMHRHTHAHTRAHTHTHTCAHTHTHTCTHTHMHTQTHARTHAHTHTRTHSAVHVGGSGNGVPCVVGSAQGWRGLLSDCVPGC